MIICLFCGQLNNDGLERCLRCDALLKKEETQEFAFGIKTEEEE